MKASEILWMLKSMYLLRVNETAQQYIRPTYQISDCIINGMVDKDYIKVITDKILNKLIEICA